MVRRESASHNSSTQGDGCGGDVFRPSAIGTAQPTGNCKVFAKMTQNLRACINIALLVVQRPIRTPKEWLAALSVVMASAAFPDS